MSIELLKEWRGASRVRTYIYSAGLCRPPTQSSLAVPQQQLAAGVYQNRRRRASERR